MSGDAGELSAWEFVNYTPNGTTYLEPFTTYWVAVSAFGGTAKIRVADINDDQDGLRHWTIGDDTRDRVGNFVSTHSISMTVYGTSAPADKLAVSNRARGSQSSNLAETRVIGTSFTTGSTEYVLNKVRLLMTRDAGASVNVSIRKNATGNTIGTTIEALTADGTVSTGDIAQIDYSSDGLFLAANTTYWVVVGISGGNGKVELATSDSEDPEAATGWSLGNHTEDINSDDDYSANSLKMQVFADETEELDSVVVVSQPLDGDTYKGGENLEIEYRFTAEVVHVSGTARLNLGDQARRAEYISGSGTNTLLYSYVVQSTDVDTDNGFNIGDNDHPTVTVSFAQAAYTMAEGATQQVSVSVSADPERTTIIPITATPQGTASAADYTVMPSVTFYDADTGSKIFTIVVTQDLIDDDNEKVALGFGTMPDPRVSAGTQDETTVSITDDDTAGILFSPTSLTVEEEDSVGYTVALATEPTVNVSVTITVHTGTDLELVSNRLTNDVLTFTSLNWHMPQAVTVETAHDDDGVADSETLAHAAAGAEYDGVDADLTGTVNDNDPLGIILQPLELTVPESGHADYGVRLATEPTVAVTLNISGHNGTDLTLTVAAAHDDDREDDLEFQSHNASGGEYEAMMEALPVTVDDNTGDLRLVDGPPIAEDEEPCEGRLEIYCNGEWGTICDDNWSTEDADTACRALGFPDGSVNSGRFGSGIFPTGDRDQPIWLDDLSCDGGESHLLDCRSSPVGVNNCQHAEDVGLRCLKTTGPWIVNAEFSQPYGEDGRYGAGETVTVTLVWSEAVTVSTSMDGFPRVALLYGGQADLLYHPSGSGTQRTVFTHTLRQTEGETSLDQIRLSRDSLALRDPDNPLTASASISSVATGDAAILGHRTYSSNEEGTMPSTSEGQAEPGSLERPPLASRERTGSSAQARPSS